MGTSAARTLPPAPLFSRRLIAGGGSQLPHVLSLKPDCLLAFVICYVFKDRIHHPYPVRSGKLILSYPRDAGPPARRLLNLKNYSRRAKMH